MTKSTALLMSHFTDKKGPVMGRGDIRSRKGKIFAKSFGNRRPHPHNRKNKGAAQRSPTRVLSVSPDRQRT